MSFIFTGLKSLYVDMQIKKEYRAIFSVDYKKRNFSCLFLCDISPYRFIIIPTGDATFAIELQIGADFSTKSYIENYHQLVHFLGITYDPNHKFLPTDFFVYINKKVPSTFSNRPSLEQVLAASNRCHEIERGDQLHFCGLRRNPQGEKVSPKNYEKTRLAFGDRTAKLLRKYNVSTCWTDDESKKNLAEINKFLSRF